MTEFGRDTDTPWRCRKQRGKAIKVRDKEFETTVSVEALSPRSANEVEIQAGQSSADLVDSTAYYE